ncbi:FGGY-family carbohydrate kinase [Asanoa sp. NPDC049518]|uniref:FGGY-family carbohydrate kinase n=1 Tax=unclassified Asanoa TaxID=2685164 RepID=UPI00342C8A7F
MPAPHPPMVLTAAAVDITAGTVWGRAAQLALETIAAADLEPTEVSAVICIGGGANSPAAVQAIADAVGQKPLVPDDPGRAALWGAAGATPATDDQVDASDGSWAAARAVARHVPALVVAGVASLAMFAQFVLQADPQNGTPFNHDQHYWVLAAWGQHTIAAVCAMIACLSTGWSARHSSRMRNGSRSTGHAWRPAWPQGPPAGSGSPAPTPSWAASCWACHPERSYAGRSCRCCPSLPWSR